MDELQVIFNHRCECEFVRQWVCWVSGGTPVGGVGARGVWGIGGWATLHSIRARLPEVKPWLLHKLAV